MQTTLFTGAGASRAIGYPLTWEILPAIRKGLKEATLFQCLGAPEQHKGDRLALLGYLQRLLPGFSTAADKVLPLVTDVFSMVEYSLASGEALPVGTLDDLARFRDLLKMAMTSVLLEAHEKRWKHGDADERQWEETYGELIHWIRQQEDLGIVTTNYDTGIEVALLNSEAFANLPQDRSNLPKDLDLGFSWRDTDKSELHLRPHHPKLRLYKLHGSLDVLRCPLCGQVYFNPDGTIAHQAYRRTLDDNNLCTCNRQIRLDLQIVAPSFVREVRDSNLLSTWQAALEWMRTSEHWIIVGYSLPPEDLAIRSLLVRAYAGAGKDLKITVVMKSEDQKPRYSMLFPRCDYRVDGLEGFLKNQEVKL